MTTTVYDYEVHPLAKLFPPLPSDEFKKLKNDIATHGQQDPIMLSADGTTLLDGVNRLRICKELGIEPRILRFDYEKNPAREADYIWAKNVLRRHLSAGQRAAIAHKWSDAERTAAKERQKASRAKPGEKVGSRKVVVNSPPPSKTRKAIAQKARVSEHKVRQVETVAKHAPELLPGVETGQVTLKDAAKIASTKTEVQKPEAKPFDLNPAIGRIRDCVLEEHRKVPSEHQRWFRAVVVDRITTWAWVLNVQEDDAQEDQK